MDLPYHPGQILSFKLPRNPVQPCIQFFLPSAVLSIFVLASHFIVDEFDEDGNIVEDNFADMLLTVALSLLTLVGIYQQVRDALPPTLEISFIEKVILLYTIYCLLPVLDHVFLSSALAGMSGYIVFGVLNFVIFAVMGIKFFRQLHAARDRPIPKRVGGKGGVIVNSFELEWAAPDDFAQKR